MKRLVSLFLVFALIFNLYAPSFIAAAQALNPEDLTQVTQENSQEESKPEIYDLEGLEATGNLEIDVKFTLPINNIVNPNIAVNLKDANGNIQKIDFNGITEMQHINYKLGEQTGEIVIRKLDQEGNVLNGVDGQQIKYYSITVYQLKKGSYSIELSGSGYKTYVVKDVTLDRYAKRVTITNEKGMFEVGDVNQDGVVNDTDINDVIAHMDSTNENDIKRYDLNRDGSINIADIALIASTINGAKKTVQIDPTSLLVEQSTMVEAILAGNVKDLFQEGGQVVIKPAKDTEEISENNPAVLSVDMKNASSMSQIRLDTALENQPEEVEVEITDESGNVTTYKASLNQLETIHYFTDKASANTIVIDLKGQIAVKKVTIKITKASNKNLAEIAKVEFLNQVYEEVPVPVIQIPKNINVEVLDESASINYNEMPNITGYELLVQTMSNGQVTKNEIFQTTYTSYNLVGLKNYTTYQVSVRAINGEWKSGYSDPVTFVPKPTHKPPRVDMVNITPTYAGLNISWKDMRDTLTYNLYYRKLGQKEYQVVHDISKTNCQLRGLEVNTIYEVYLTGNNDLGEGLPSDVAKGKTQSLISPIIPKYKLINTSNGVGKVTNHIENVLILSGSVKNGNKFSVVDDNHLSYWEKQDWDSGVHYAYTAPIVAFDKTYKMQEIIITVPDDFQYQYSQAKISYWNGLKQETVDASITKKQDENNRHYYVVKTDKPIEADSVQVMVSHHNHLIQFAEVKYYQYDSLQDDVAALFKDDLRIELNENVTLKTIETLQVRANTKDTISGEYHPYRNSILNDLEYAKKILTDTDLQDVITVDQTISTSRNSHLGFSTLSDLQPLGIAVRAKEQIHVYVGTKGDVLPQLVFTQYYAEASVWKQVVTNLKKGKNIIEVPQIGSMATERGGSVYIRYPSANTGPEIKVRVSGGTKIPVLDLHKVTKETKSKQLIQTYIKELKQYKDSLPSLYKKEGKTFDANTSVLNTTEIVTKNGLFSISATSAYNGISAGLKEESAQVSRLYQSLTAFEEMMALFYRHKGLSEQAEQAIDKTPASRINIRSMRMFDGAFMYASEDHIGIGHGSTPGLMQGRPNQIVNGQISTSGYFGWGISHEIGHQINQGKIASAEVTNNVFSLLAQTNDDQQTSRMEDRYSKIYQKVTSNTVGKSSDVFVSLAMYWQLHLAYDDAKTSKDTNSIYAKMNRELRRSTLSGYSADELTIISASLAAGKDLTTFFEKWGLVVTDRVKNILKEKNLVKEERPIWYLNDEARRYRLNHGSRMSTQSVVKASFKEANSQKKRYTLSFYVENNNNPDAILGYEIKRNGEVIAFVTENEFTDVIGSLNNHALIYEVTAYDNYLNATKTVQLDEVKLTHDGSIHKDNFDISSNFKEESETGDYENPNIDPYKLSINHLIDGNVETIFNGTTRIQANDKTNPNIIIDLNTTLDISGIKYRAASKNGVMLKHFISKYNVYVSQDKEKWILAKTGTFLLNQQNNYTDTIYFDKEQTNGGDQLWTYSDISYVKIEAIGNKGISGAEIDIIAPPGDNIDLSKETIGVLTRPYLYLNSEKKIRYIPKGSVVFKGNYRGNPAFNAMLLVDTATNNAIEGENFLFAKLNSQAKIHEIANGYWFYVVTPEQYKTLKGKRIRAELYRVDNALTNEGQRLTSTSLSVTNLPEYNLLPKMEIIDSTKGE